MNHASDIADCKWSEPGGLAAARKICAFLQTANFPVSVAPISGKTFVPGLAIVEGSILIDPDTESFPGDLLHEAGHIAVCAPELRSKLCEV